jgi:hypothetical protein
MSRQQLRVYRIEPGHLDDFAAAWTSGVLPLRARHGFTSRAWTVPDEDTFVWLLSYDGPGSFGDADAEYYRSPERAALEPDPAHWIVRIESKWLEPVEEP